LGVPYGGVSTECVGVARGRVAVSDRAVHAGSCRSAVADGTATRSDLHSGCLVAGGVLFVPEKRSGGGLASVGRVQ
jgi:hypothetical protein